MIRKIQGFRILFNLPQVAADNGGASRAGKRTGLYSPHSRVQPGNVYAERSASATNYNLLLT